jgi:SNF2 family DNA or RNA helicase
MRAVISSVEPYDAPPDGRIHLVTVEYTDPEGSSEDTLIWEHEHGRESRTSPRCRLPISMRSCVLPAGARWRRSSPWTDPAAADRRIAAPFFGAVQAEDFQLVPLLKALSMSRVSLLLADDVGLGKTIEAGLVLTELLLRRRIRLVLVLCPASLRHHWEQEMREKFSLHFDVVDRIETYDLQKKIGLDANPWRSLRALSAHITT